MQFHIRGQQQPYDIQNPEKIHTPRLLVYRDRVEHNLNQMQQILEKTAPGTGFHHLCSHVKTSKSSEIIQMMMKRGITSFKTSLNEVDLLCQNDVSEIFVAYPLLKNDAEKLADTILSYPKIKIFVQAGSKIHVDTLQQISQIKKVDWHVYIDLDVGMHRTGTAPEKAWELYTYLSQFDELQFVGLHGYDGHNHHAEPEMRMTTARATMDCLVAVFKDFIKRGVSVPRVMTGGSPSFQADFELLYPQINAETFLQVSPGTWIFWDSKSDQILPGAFALATFVFAQVIEVSNENRITLNLGHKRWAIDQGPVELFSHPGLEIYSYNEEHTVLTHRPEDKFEIGDYILIVPKHVCSTVNLYDYFVLIDKAGDIIDPQSPVDGRNK